jgi:hypothetical protein
VYKSKISGVFIAYYFNGNFTSKELGKVIKKTVREIETGEGILIFDDTLQEKPHSKENDLICWHYDHCVNRSDS